jgi:ribosomal protein S18 acetylase RimI-like enzyme
MSDHEITRAAPDRLPDLAGVLGRAFVDEAMIRWPLGSRANLETIIAMFAILYEAPIGQGVVYEAGDADGVAVWVPPGGGAELLEADVAARGRYGPLTPDGGARYEALWGWIQHHVPSEPLWYLDALAVDPPRQGAGIGTSLIRHGLAMAARDGVGAFLETSVARNVAYYERFGFQVVDQGDAPDGGPHIWFMRC